MKKRLLCLLLCLLLVVPMVLTGCATTEEEETADVDQDTGAKSVTMRVVTEKKVCNSDKELAEYLANECGGDKESQKYKDMLATMKVYSDVEAAFTKITKSKHKINVDLMFYTAEEYFGAPVDDPATEIDETKGILKSSMEEYAIWEQEAQVAERALDKYIADYLDAYPGYSEKAITESFYTYFPEYKDYRNYTSSDDEDVAFEEQYRENELGIKELVYPETQESQLDIIYISGLDMYNEYIDNEWIASLDEQIATTGKKLSDYISPALLGGVKVDGSTYAIPNNVMIGEYTYMLIDKTLFDTYYGNINSVTNVVDADIERFLEDVAENSPEVLPIDGSFEDCMKQLVWYWNINYTEDDFGNFSYSIDTDNKFSVIGKVYGDPATVGRGQIELGVNSLFTQEEYREIYLTLKRYEFNNFFATENETRGDAAVSFVNGSYAIKKEALDNNGVYTDENGKQYYPIVVKYPEADESSLYGNMFAISSNSKNSLACMQVLTLLNTNSDLRNILQYGVEGLDYMIDEDTNTLVRLDRTVKLSDGFEANYGKVYQMQVERTGNCFIAHPEEGLAADYWENAKAQNNDALINPLLGFDFDAQLEDYGTHLDNILINDTKTLAEQTLAKINSCDTYEELEDLLNNKETGLCTVLDPEVASIITSSGGKKGARLAKYCNPKYDTSGGGDDDAADTYGESPYTIYYGWLEAYSFLPK